jgi:hypothetical protein
MSITKLTQAETGISTYCYQDPLIFTHHLYCKELNAKVYTLNPKMLSKEKCHFFFDLQAVRVEMLIAKTLEFFTFNPKTTSADKFHFNIIICHNFPMYWCSFPRQYKDVCERIAAAFKMKIRNEQQLIVALTGAPSDESDLPALKFTREHRYEGLPEKDDVRKPVAKDALALPAKGDSSGVVIGIPKANHILSFDGELIDSTALENREKWIAERGNDLHAIELD